MQPISGRSLAKGGNIEKAPFKASVEDFYLSNPIATRFSGDGGMLPLGVRANADGGGVT